MRWFKHLSSASDDPFLVDLEARFGLEGYARWWKLLEAVASQVNPKEGRWTVSYPWAKWQQILQGKRKKLETFLEHLANLRRISTVSSENILEIGICNLQKYIDEYSRKSGATTERLRTKDTDTEAETEKGIKGTPSVPSKTQVQTPPPGAAPDWQDLDHAESAPDGQPGKRAKAKGLEYSKSFEQFWAEYPRKRGKEAAYRRWKAIPSKYPGLKVQDIIKALKRQVEADNFRGSNGDQFIPNPDTWLNQARWMDELKNSGPAFTYNPLLDGPRKPVEGHQQ